MDSTLVGVVIGAVLGGGGQVVADSLREKRERRRWIDDHRREAYLSALTGLRAVVSHLFSASIEHSAYDEAPGPKDGPFEIPNYLLESNVEYFAAREDVNFYGSAEVLGLLDAAESLVMGEGFHLMQTEYSKLRGFYADAVSPAMDAVSEAMRRELGMIN